MKKLIYAAALLGIVACHTENDADRAAKNLDDKREELSQTFDDKAKAANEGVQDLAQKVGEVNTARTQFEIEREAQIAKWRAMHALDVTVPTYVAAALSVAPITELGRISVNEKLAVLDTRIGEAAHALENLQTIGSTEWQPQSDKTLELMNRLQAAVDDAIDALRDAPRLPQTSS